MKELLDHYAPRIGAPEPNPGSTPDLTLPFRERDKTGPSESRPRETSGTAQFQRGRAAGYRTPAEFEEKIEEIQRHRRAGSEGNTEETLSRLRTEAVQTYGKSHRIVELIEAAMSQP